MRELKKKAIVVHSGGMDSSICLALAMREYDPADILSLSFSYGQRHTTELDAAVRICKDWHVDHVIVDLSCLQAITHNALMDTTSVISHGDALNPPNTLVVGRNGLMARLAGIHINSLGGHVIYMGIIGVEAANSGYRDCTRSYMDKVEEVLRIDFDDERFEIKTPIVHMTKKETLLTAYNLGVLEYLLLHTVTCYEGIPKQGCQRCPACLLRNEGIREFSAEHPECMLPYEVDKTGA